MKRYTPTAKDEQFGAITMPTQPNGSAGIRTQKPGAGNPEAGSQGGHAKNPGQKEVGTIPRGIVY